MIDFDDEVRVVFYTQGFEHTRDFYEKILALPVIKSWNHSGKNGIVYGLGNMFIEFLESDTAPKSYDSYLYIKVKNIDSLYRKIKENNANSILQDIQIQEWGHRNFVIEDNNGIKMKFFEELSV